MCSVTAKQPLIMMLPQTCVTADTVFLTKHFKRCIFCLIWASLECIWSTEFDSFCDEEKEKMSTLGFCSGLPKALTSTLLKVDGLCFRAKSAPGKVSSSMQGLIQISQQNQHKISVLNPWHLLRSWPISKKTETNADRRMFRGESWLKESWVRWGLCYCLVLPPGKTTWWSAHVTNVFLGLHDNNCLLSEVNHNMWS